MNYKRALSFSVLLYAILLVLMIGIQIFTKSYQMGLKAYILVWLVTIPVVLFLSKWYFKLDPPTAKKGFMLGIIALVCGFLLDLLLIVLASYEQGTTFKQLFMVFYGDWKFYVAVAEILAFTSFAGFEFDATYTKKAT